jgi:hypothetical protein
LNAEKFEVEERLRNGIDDGKLLARFEARLYTHDGRLGGRSWELM